MFDKNPYENEDQFESIDEKNEDEVDMSAFNLADNNSETQDYDYDDDDDEEGGRRKLNYKGVVIIGAVLIVLLLIASIAGWIFGISKNNALTKLKDEYATLETKLTTANNDLATLKNEYTLLSAELEKLKTQSNESGTTETGTGTTTEEGTKYKMTEGVAVRTGAGSSNAIVNYDDLPEDIQNIVYYDKDNKKVTTREAVFPILETKQDSNSNTWGRIAKGAWVCLVYQGETWGTKQ